MNPRNIARASVLALAILALHAGAEAGPPAAWNVTTRRTFEVNSPAFVSVEPGGARSADELVICSFGVWPGRDQVQTAPGIGALLDGGSPLALTRVTGDVTWPNEARRLDAGVVGRPAWLIAGGFLVPGRTGAITLLDASDPRARGRELTVRRGGWFYHRTLLRDMDGDGKLDILTARGTKPIFGAAAGELVWLRQPATNPFETPWTETVIARGPDVNFASADLDGDGKEEILTTEFFGRRLRVFWRESTGWSDRSVDTTLGAGFDLELADLNGDKRLDLLVTNHEGTAAASVFGYEIPRDFRTAPWVRHTLLTGIPTVQGGPGAGSPGRALSFRPTSDQAWPKPLILVGGDGSRRAHLLTPKSWDPADWSYAETILVQSTGTIGGCAVADVDRDGRTELFIPAYDEGVVHVLNVEPRTSKRPERPAPSQRMLTW